jgi:hypothetical protein
VLLMKNEGRLPLPNDSHRPDRYQVMEARLASRKAAASRQSLEVRELERLMEKP